MPKTEFQYYLSRLLLLLLIACITGCAGFRKSSRPEPAPLPRSSESVQLGKCWQRKFGSGEIPVFFDLQPALYKNQWIATAALNGVISAWDQDHGRKLWQKKLTDQQWTAGPVVQDEGLLALSSLEGELLILDGLKQGQTLWAKPLEQEVLAAPALNQQSMVVRTTSGKTFTIDLHSGTMVWQKNTMEPSLITRGYSAPLVSEDTLWLPLDQGIVSAHQLADGSKMWEATIEAPRGGSIIERITDIDAPMVRDNGILYVLGIHGHLVAILEQTGVLLWEAQLKGGGSILALHRGQQKIIAADGTDVLFAYNANDGMLVWENDKFRHRGISALTAGGDLIAVGEKKGFVHWLDPDSGTIVARRRPKHQTIIDIRRNNEGRWFILSANHHLTCYARR